VPNGISAKPRFSLRGTVRMSDDEITGAYEHGSRVRKS
jgi:hypothetical protein